MLHVEAVVCVQNPYSIYPQDSFSVTAAASFTFQRTRYDGRCGLYHADDAHLHDELRSMRPPDGNGLFSTRNRPEPRSTH